MTGADVQKFLVLMRQTFGLMSVVVANAVSTMHWAREIGIPEGWHARFEQIRTHDPSQRDLMNAPLGTWWVKSKCDDPDNLVFQEGLRFGIRDVAIAVLPGPFRSMIRLVLGRSVEQEDFSNADIALLRLLYPHFVGAIGTQFALAALHQPADETRPAEMAGYRGHAYLSFPSGRVEWGKDGKEFWSQHLGRRTGRAWKPLADALLAAAAEFYGAHLAARSQPLIGGVRVEFAFVPPQGDEVRRVLALFIEEADSEAERAGPGRLASPESSLLTARQLDVARLASVGQSLPQIATELGVSEHTARSHLREAYRRLGINSRAELAQKLSGQ